MMGKEQDIREMWEPCCQERTRFREEAEEERQTGIQGQRQVESPAREYLEQVKCCNDTDCTHGMRKQGFFALKSGEWQEYKNTFRKEVQVSERVFDRIKEAFEKVAKDEAIKLSAVQEIMTRSADYMRRIVAPAGGKETSRCHTCARVTVSRWKTTFGGSLRGKSIQIGGVRSVENNMTGSNQTGFWWCKEAKVLIRPRSSDRMQYLRAYAGT